MSISEISIPTSQMNVQNPIDAALLKNSMEVMETQGLALQKMIMESSVNPHLGQNFDMSV